jgi:hypothetical protein
MPTDNVHGIVSHACGSTQIKRTGGSSPSLSWLGSARQSRPPPFQGILPPRQPNRRGPQPLKWRWRDPSIILIRDFGARRERERERERVFISFHFHFIPTLALGCSNSHNSHNSYNSYFTYTFRPSLSWPNTDTIRSATEALNLNLRHTCAPNFVLSLRREVF